MGNETAGTPRVPCLMNSTPPHARAQYPRLGPPAPEARLSRREGRLGWRRHCTLGMSSRGVGAGPPNTSLPPSQGQLAGSQLSPGGPQHFVEQLLRDFPEVDLCPHQRDQVHLHPLLAGSGERLFLVLRRQEKRMEKGVPELSAPSAGRRRWYTRALGKAALQPCSKRFFKT